MIFLLLFATQVWAADLSRECQANDPGLQRFFSEYVGAYAKADRKALQKLFAPNFWTEFAEFAPKKSGKNFRAKILSARARGNFCFVEWKSSSTKEEGAAWFRLASAGEGWKIDGIPGEAEE